MINKTFGHLTIKKECPHEKGEPIYYLCQCSCGKMHKARGSEIRRGKVRSCGCQSYKNGKKKKDIINQRFGSLIVLEPCLNTSPTLWKCICDCGKICYITRNNLVSHNTTSCGCKAHKSKGETLIDIILKENNIFYKREFSFNDLLGKNNHPLRFDFAIFNNNETKILKLIEFNGIQHYDTNNNYYSEELHQADLKKQEYCLKNNIPLQIINYWELSNINSSLILADIKSEIKEINVTLEDIHFINKNRSFTKEQLIQEIGSSNFEAAGRKYNMSGNNLRYWCKKYNLPTHISEIKKLYKKMPT